MGNLKAAKINSHSNAGEIMKSLFKRLLLVAVAAGLMVQATLTSGGEPQPIEERAHDW